MPIELIPLVFGLSIAVAFARITLRRFDAMILGGNQVSYANHE